MAETFEKVLIKDDRIGCITPQVKFGVFKGGQNVTAMPFKAISQTTSAHVFNVPVPSLETIISREVLWSSIVTLKISVASGSTKPAGKFLVNYGVTDALSPFPLHSLVATMTSTINNNTVSINMADVLPVMLRMMEPEELATYDDMTPTCLDYLGNYRDGYHEMEYYLDRAQITEGGGEQALTLPVIPFFGNQPESNQNIIDNATPADAKSGTAPTTYLSYPNNVLGFDMHRPAGCTITHKPRGNYKLMAIYSIDPDTGGRRIPEIDDTTVYVQFRVTEPLLLSPYIFGSGEGKQGFYGIQTMNYQMNMLSNANRTWRTGESDFLKTCLVDSFEDSTLYFQFLTPHASEMLEARNVVPYYEFPVYRTTNFATIEGIGTGLVQQNGTVGPAAGRQNTAILNSSNIQLNGIPDKLLIFVRKNLQNLTPNESDKYLTITSIRINFNNQAGLLASQSQQQLYRNSKLSGLNLSWEQFSGYSMSVSGQQGGFSEPASAYRYSGACFTSQYNTPDVTNASTIDPGFKMISTTGSILALNFAEVIQLTDEYYAPASLGTFNLQVSLNVENNHQEDWKANTYEMILIPMNSGVFVNERGTSSTFLSLLTKQDVLDSLTQTPYTNFEVHRLVGGAHFLDKLRSGLHWIHSKLPAVKNTLGYIPHPVAQTAHNVLGALGYGMSAGGMSAGGASGGRRSIEERVKS
jgi:hypothetical protein